MSGQNKYKISGHTVMFPCKPYPSQFSMMDKILKGIERSQNCLLESPTGSGKSLALLCSVLAWQTAMKKTAVEVCSCACHTGKEEQPLDQLMCSSNQNTVTNMADVSKDIIASGDHDDDDFKSVENVKWYGTSSGNVPKKRNHLSVVYASGSPTSNMADLSVSGNVRRKVLVSLENQAMPGVVKVNSDKRSSGFQCVCTENCGKAIVKKVPKIYFGTRTHKQVSQIVRELRKTEYCDTPMTILASREHTCVNPQVACSSNKTESCENLVKGGEGCLFKDRAVRYQNHSALQCLGVSTAWDLEELVDVLKKKKACPYFVSRGLLEHSDLVICPYNYLVDPIIRENMDIKLRGQEVILDEAHNIEDAAREAASRSVTQEDIRRAKLDMDNLINHEVRVADVSKLRQMCHSLDMFIDSQSSMLVQHGFNESYRLWSGFEIVAMLHSLRIGMVETGELVALATCSSHGINVLQSANLLPLNECVQVVARQEFSLQNTEYGRVMADLTEDREKDVSGGAITKLLVHESSCGLLPYVKELLNVQPETVMTMRFISSSQPAAMSLTCQGFADFDICRSVILMSGTLSPMDSFQSELGLPFPIVLEANHIIKDSQVWVGAVGEGLDGVTLRAVYRNMDRFEFQDSLGGLIVEICVRVPMGILCFFPSYKALEMLTNRWKTTGLWGKLQEHKCILSEPSRSDKAVFQRIIHTYCNAINKSLDGSNTEGATGALLFAVCRGKVSEGIDFSDDFARAVITIGIPYSNVKDIQVELKRKYNDRYHVERKLLSGQVWYEIQAFRALNQALGRCLRHKNDWGALIIIDDRFVKNAVKFSAGLSKWVRQRLQVYRKCQPMLESLQVFAESRVLADRSQSSIVDFVECSPVFHAAINSCYFGCSHDYNRPLSLPFSSDTNLQLSPVGHSAAVAASSLDIISPSPEICAARNSTCGFQKVSKSPSSGILESLVYDNSYPANCINEAGVERSKSGYSTSGSFKTVSVTAHSLQGAGDIEAILPKNSTVPLNTSSTDNAKFSTVSVIVFEQSIPIVRPDLMLVRVADVEISVECKQFPISVSDCLYLGLITVCGAKPTMVDNHSFSGVEPATGEEIIKCVVEESTGHVCNPPDIRSTVTSMDSVMPIHLTLPSEKAEENMPTVCCLSRSQLRVGHSHDSSSPAVLQVANNILRRDSSDTEPDASTRILHTGGHSSTPYCTVSTPGPLRSSTCTSLVSVFNSSDQIFTGNKHFELLGDLPFFFVPLTKDNRVIVLVLPDQSADRKLLRLPHSLVPDVDFVKLPGLIRHIAFAHTEGEAITFLYRLLQSNHMRDRLPNSPSQKPMPCCGQPKQHLKDMSSVSASQRRSMCQENSERSETSSVFFNNSYVSPQPGTSISVSEPKTFHALSVPTHDTRSLLYSTGRKNNQHIIVCCVNNPKSLTSDISTNRQVKSKARDKARSLCKSRLRKGQPLFIEAEDRLQSSFHNSNDLQNYPPSCCCQLTCGLLIKSSACDEKLVLAEAAEYCADNSVVYSFMSNLSSASPSSIKAEIPVTLNGFYGHSVGRQALDMTEASTGGRQVCGDVAESNVVSSDLGNLNSNVVIDPSYPSHDKEGNKEVPLKRRVRRAKHPRLSLKREHNTL